MTTEFVLRLDKKRAEHFEREARKRRKTRNALMRQALDNLLGEPRSNTKEQTVAKHRNGKAAVEKPVKGVGWKAHFEWLRKHGRRVGSKEVDEIIHITRGRDRL